MTKTRLLTYAGLTALLIAAAYYPTFIWLYERYISPESYYSHGFIVPLIAAYLIWLKRHELETVQARYHPGGLSCIVIALIVHFLSVLAGVYFVSGYTLLLLAIGCSLYFFGLPITRRIAFPLVFIVFMLPLPLTALNAVSFPLRMFATKAAVMALNVAGGIPAQSEGFRILLPHASLVVGTPCSGLRSIISMAALGSILAYLLKGNAARKFILVALALPIALVTNVLRIILLSLGVHFRGEGIMHGWYHDVTGYVILLASIGMLWYARKALEWQPRYR